MVVYTADDLRNVPLPQVATLLTEKHQRIDELEAQLSAAKESALSAAEADRGKCRATMIRRVRREQGLQMSSLARAANLTDSNLSRLETGKNKAGASVRARLSAALATPESVLFDPSGWPMEACNA